MLWQWLLGAGCAFLLALVTTPAGVSGAVLLLPVQVGVLGVASPAVTPTNLLYNVFSTPGALMRFAREGRLRVPLTGLLVAGTLPGVIVGAIVRVEWLSNPRDFAFVAAGVLLPLGLWLLLGSQRMPRPQPAGSRRFRGAVWVLALVVGVVGGIYGIGGGSLLAPILIALGFSVYEVAPATLAATFLTSLAGIAAFQVLQLSHGGAIAPEWTLGAFLGAGGFAGSYCGARLQRRLPERGLRRLLGCVACLVAARYFEMGVTERPASSAARYLPLRSRCLHPGQQQGRRWPSSSSSCVRRMRRVRVASCLASSTQQMNSLRANGVMSFQASSAVALAISAPRRSVGNLCTTPPGTL